MRGKRSEGGGGGEFVAKKARETVAVALRDARALSAPYALEEDGFDDGLSLVSSSSSSVSSSRAKLNATSLALFPNVKNALELVKRRCVDTYFSGSKSIALGAFINNWTIIASVLLTAKSEKTVWYWSSLRCCDYIHPQRLREARRTILLERGWRRKIWIGRFRCRGDTLRERIKASSGR